jgi:hypothetical protein
VSWSRAWSRRRRRLCASSAEVSFCARERGRGTAFLLSALLLPRVRRARDRRSVAPS